MNYKETLFFIGKCLTISHEEENFLSVAKQIKQQEVDWDNVVKVSTAQFVFPALYCNLKRRNLLSYLPEDLVSYMEHITHLNRERNLEIIKQAKEINSLLKENGITPIFLKGVAFLLQDFYHDIAERMVGDIDFLVSKKDILPTISILKNKGYFEFLSEAILLLDHRHYPRLKNNDGIAAVEVHTEMTKVGYRKEFNFSIIEKSIYQQGLLNFLSYSDQLALTLISIQINDLGQYYKTISLRNSYDVFMLSTKVNSLKAISNFNKLFIPLNNFLAITHKVLSSKKIIFKRNQKAHKYFISFDKIISNAKYRESHAKREKLKINFRTKCTIIIRSFYRKDYREMLYKMIINKIQFFL